MEDLNLWVTLILAALLAISEVLALIPSVKSNGVFDFIVNLLKSAQALLGKDE